MASLRFCVAVGVRLGLLALFVCPTLSAKIAPNRLRIDNTAFPLNHLEKRITLASELTFGLFKRVNLSTNIAANMLGIYNGSIKTSLILNPLLGLALDLDYHAFRLTRNHMQTLLPQDRSENVDITRIAVALPLSLHLKPRIYQHFVPVYRHYQYAPVKQIVDDDASYDELAFFASWEGREDHPKAVDDRGLAAKLRDDPLFLLQEYHVQRLIKSDINLAAITEFMLVNGNAFLLEFCYGFDIREKSFRVDDVLVKNRLDQVKLGLTHIWSFEILNVSLGANLERNTVLAAKENSDKGRLAKERFRTHLNGAIYWRF